MAKALSANIEYEHTHTQKIKQLNNMAEGDTQNQPTTGKLL